MQTLGSNASSFNQADGRTRTVWPDAALPGVRANFTRRGLRVSDATDELSHRYVRLRHQSEALITPLGPEDMVVQSMPDASPAKLPFARGIENTLMGGEGEPRAMARKSRRNGTSFKRERPLPHRL